MRTSLGRDQSESWSVPNIHVSQNNCNEVVKIEKDRDALTISNDLIAVRIPSQEALSAYVKSQGAARVTYLTDIFNLGKNETRAVALAPVQGIQLANGEWTGVGPNALVARAEALTSATVSIDEAGPLRATVTVRYEFRKQSIQITARNTYLISASHT